MELHLLRTYYAAGTNGVLTLDGEVVCFTIELPWRDNRKGKSCIPKGKYRLETRYSPHFEDHLLVEKVPDRTWILIHPANNALKELRGCIAPVSRLTGQGKGDDSRPAFLLVKDLVYDAIRRRERVWLIISSQNQ